MRSVSGDLAASATVERPATAGAPIDCPLGNIFGETDHEAAYIREAGRIVCDVCGETVSARLAVAIVGQTVELWNARHDDVYRDDNSERFAEIRKATASLLRRGTPARELAEVLVLVADCRPPIPGGVLIEWCRP